MTAPKRIQLSREKGWRKPEGAVVVARPSKWGNPVTLWVVRQMWNDLYGPYTPAAGRAEAVDSYRKAVLTGEDYVPSVDDIRRELAGRDLACWCPLEDAQGNRVPCHADVLLEIANGEPR